MRLLNEEELAFLEEYRVGEDVPKNAIPIFYDTGEDEPKFLPDYACVGGKARTKFIAEAPRNLWLGGGAILVYVPLGLVVVPDRRKGGNFGPAAQGWARYDEGSDLRLAALREFREELQFYILTRPKPGDDEDSVYLPCVEVVPSGFVAAGHVKILNLPLDHVLEFGQIVFDNWTRNRQDRAIIYVGRYDLRQLPDVERLRIIYDDDFPQERHPGTNPRVVDLKNGQVVGVYDGLQGYLPNDMKFHPVTNYIVQTSKR